MELIRMDMDFHDSKDYYIDGRKDKDVVRKDKLQNSIQAGNMGQDFNIVNISLSYYQNIYHNAFFYLTLSLPLHHNTKFPFLIPFFLKLFFQ